MDFFYTLNLTYSEFDLCLIQPLFASTKYVPVTGHGICKTNVVQPWHSSNFAAFAHTIFFFFRQHCRSLTRMMHLTRTSSSPNCSAISGCCATEPYNYKNKCSCHRSEPNIARPVASVFTLSNWVFFQKIMEVCDNLIFIRIYVVIFLRHAKRIV